MIEFASLPRSPSECETRRQQVLRDGGASEARIARGVRHPDDLTLAEARAQRDALAGAVR